MAWSPAAARFLCIDLGDKRTGLAIGDSVLKIASPLDVLEVPKAQRDGGALLDALVAAIAEQRPTGLVIGLPLNMDGTEGPRSRMAREFGQRLAGATGLSVHYQDERLTSTHADWQMARTGMTRGQKKAKRDALAAAAILRDFLASLAGGESSSSIGNRPEGEPEGGIGR